jgi:hypothetical protein
MSKQIERFWADVKATESGIRERFVVMVSIQRPERGVKGGALMEVERRAAAELIVAGSHRLATKEEERLYRAKHEADRRAQIEEGRRKAGVVVVTIPARKGK